MQNSQVCSSSVCLPENYNKMDLPPTSGPVIVNTTIILIDIFEVSPSLPWSSFKYVDILELFLLIFKRNIK